MRYFDFDSPVCRQRRCLGFEKFCSCVDLFALKGRCQGDGVERKFRCSSHNSLKAAAKVCTFVFSCVFKVCSGCCGEGEGLFVNKTNGHD